jgi:Uma2 family endonuclease
MTVTSQRMTLDEYLAFDDGTDTQYEPVNGELVAVLPESELNRRIAMFLLVYFVQQGISTDRLSMKTEIVVSGSRATTRIPDLIVLSEELASVLEGANL